MPRSPSAHLERQTDRQLWRFDLLQLPRQQEPHHREGGALVLPTTSTSRPCERLRLQGVKRFPDGGMDVDVLGGKFNLTDIAAAIGLGQLKHLQAFTARRRELARRYFSRIDPALGLELPVADFSNSNWHMFQPLLPLPAPIAANSSRR
jgi:dTDP-4-amino-4,6-dideoxygalactose transaminase